MNNYAPRASYNNTDDESLEHATWQLSFKITYKYILYIEDFLEVVADSVSVSNHKSDTIEINPEDIWQVDAYFDGKPDFESILHQLQIILNKYNVTITDLNYFPLDNLDWVSIVQEKFKPFCVERFFISSNVYKDECPNDKTPIILEASCAFGTGEHYTTKSCIEALEALSKENFKTILDVGTGTGILAIAAGKIWPSSVIMGSDIEEPAVKIALNNALYNNVNNAEFFHSDGYDNPKIEGLKFDLIISNILAGPLINLSPDIAAHSADEGYIVLSGFLENQAEAVIEAHAEVGFKLINTIIHETWVTVTMQFVGASLRDKT
jgi:ribosomal protein L11 methyltransferase